MKGSWSVAPVSLPSIQVFSTTVCRVDCMFVPMNRMGTVVMICFHAFRPLYEKVKSSLFLDLLLLPYNYKSLLMLKYRHRLG